MKDEPGEVIRSLTASRAGSMTSSAAIAHGAHSGVSRVLQRVTEQLSRPPHHRAQAELKQLPTERLPEVRILPTLR